jgi:predicted nucleic acid-binding protein
VGLIYEIFVVDCAIQIRKKFRVKTPDAIIAATAMEVGAVLVTRNEGDFKKVDGLQVINPWVS